MSSRPATLGQLRESGWESVPVKEEVRRNAVARIRSGQPLFDSVLGYEDTVLPQLENALLAGHDVIFLGERGQAKTRMIRSLTELLDEWLPIIAGSEINDDPYEPVSRHARDLVAEKGDDTPIEWVHRDTRYGEKLATPDTSIADLIGEVDPIKVAEGRYLSDELTLHYGLVPRTNRGIFAMNELPDLAERIQVGLLNVLEERDVQIRGYKVRLPARRDALRVGQPGGLHEPGPAHHPAQGPLRRADPHALPARGRDRDGHRRPGGAAARTRGGRATCACPSSCPRSCSTFSQLARQSPHINQRSGVSVRLSVTNHETLVANAARRALRLGEDVVVPRISDLDALGVVDRRQGRDREPRGRARRRDHRPPAEGRHPHRVQGALRHRAGPRGARPRSRAARSCTRATTSPRPTTSSSFSDVTGLQTVVGDLTGGDESPAAAASAIEFVLEGLHLSKRLNKDAVGSRATYRSR